jgi:excisionase family DNA binding protein
VHSIERAWPIKSSDDSFERLEAQVIRNYLAAGSEGGRPHHSSRVRCCRVKTMPEKDPDVLTLKVTKETAAYLRVHETTIYRLIRRGLPYFKVARGCRFYRPQIDDWTREQTEDELRRQLQ